MKRSVKIVNWFAATFGVLSLSVTSANALVIGNWDGSGRSWNSGPTLVGLLTSRGHTVEADGAISAANLSGDTVFVIGEATRTTTAGETADLLDWINSGGRLLMTVDSGGQGVASGNSILTALGSSLSFGGAASNGALQGGNFLTTGGPFDIVGQLLQVTPGTAVAGGSSLAGTYVAFEQIGNGLIYGFADHFQNDFFANSAANVNGQLHINLVESAAQQVTEPGMLGLVGLSLLGLSLATRQRRSR